MFVYFIVGAEIPSELRPIFNLQIYCKTTKYTHKIHIFCGSYHIKLVNMCIIKMRKT